MPESRRERLKNRKIDLLYKNLEHVSSAYFTAEQVFPFWEAAFALIVGQLLIVYFDPGAYKHCYELQRTILAVIGSVISSIWFILVSLNFQNAMHMEARAKDLQENLTKELNGEKCILDFVKPWAEDKDKEKWTRSNIFWGLREGKSFNTREAIKSTWFWRRFLPFTLVVIWIWLLAWQHYGLLGFFLSSIFIVLAILILFDP